MPDEQPQDLPRPGTPRFSACSSPHRTHHTLILVITTQGTTSYTHPVHRHTGNNVIHSSCSSPHRPQRQTLSLFITTQSTTSYTHPVYRHTGNNVIHSACSPPHRQKRQTLSRLPDLLLLFLLHHHNKALREYYCESLTGDQAREILTYVVEAWRLAM